MTICALCDAESGKDAFSFLCKTHWRLVSPATYHKFKQASEDLRKAQRRADMQWMEDRESITGRPWEIAVGYMVDCKTEAGCYR